MNNELEKIFGMSSDAVVCITENRISFMNCSADDLFGCSLIGKPAYGNLPDSILAEQTSDFVSAADIGGKKCRVSASHLNGSLVLVITPECAPSSKSTFMSDSLISSMLSSLFNIGLSLELLSGRLSPVQDEKTEQYISILYHNYYSMKRLIKNIGTAYALANGTIDFSPRSTDLARLCSDIVSTANVMLSKDVSISFTTDCGELIACIDPDKIERLLLNLIVNSCAAAPTDGQIDIRLRSRDNKAILSVDDKGCGISPEILKNVFTRYESSMSGDLSALPRCGLGLGIARGIAELHGGSLIIESRVGIGTSVRVMLPLDLPGAARFNSELAQPESTGMDNILTELSGLLESRCYSEEFRD